MKIYEIYQIKKKYLREFGFLNFEEMTNKIDIKKEFKKIYKKTYQGEIEQLEEVRVYDQSIIHHILEAIFHQFNCYIPQNYKGHSMSVSDIVKIDGKMYFCDSVGFKDIQ